MVLENSEPESGGIVKRREAILYRFLFDVAAVLS